MKKLITTIYTISLFSIISCNTNKTKNNDEQTYLNKENYIDTTHNSRNSLDWEGTYIGTIPCADCPGINIIITLNSDETFNYNASYEERNTTILDSGNFMWHNNGSVVHLKTKNLNTKYKVGENKLIQLDSDDKEIKGSNAEKYILKKLSK